MACGTPKLKLVSVLCFPERASRPTFRPVDVGWVEKLQNTKINKSPLKQISNPKNCHCM